MKKYISFLAIGVLIGCASFTREPAAVLEKIRFELFGANPLPQGDFEFELLKLGALPGKIEFDKYAFSDSLSEQAVANWQKQFEQVLNRHYEGFHFEKDKVIVDVEVEDMELLRDVLRAIEQNEPNASLRLRKKIEAIDAFGEHFKDSMDVRIDILTVPFSLLGRIADRNIPVQKAEPLNLKESSFWQPRASTDMWNGPGRFNFGNLNSEICTYKEPKTGFGVHAGFKVQCAGEKLKVKFGNEVYSGPFNSRIYHRLGYNVPAIHYVPALKVTYDRRIFTEINSRKMKYFRIRVAGLPLYDWGRLKKYDMFQFLQSANLKNGMQIDAETLKHKLLKTCTETACEHTGDNFNSGFENEIAYLTFRPSTVTEKIGEEIGPWNYSSLDHPQRTEVKSLLLLGAWTGNYDLRKDNTRLVLDKKTGEMKHYISDPGSGLGSPSGLFKSGSAISDMHWKATIESRVGTEEQTPVVGVSKYQELEANEAFRQTSFQDAQWMVKQIATVSEAEVSEALAASGLSAAEFLLAREKLLSIRQKMIEHFQLKSEFSGQMRKINRKLNFDPAKDHVDVRRQDGTVVRLENRGMGLINGSLRFPAEAAASAGHR